MFELVRREFLYAALKRSLKRRAPPQFPYSPENNFYVPTLVNAKEKQSLLVDQLTYCFAIGRLWKDDKFSEPAKIPISNLSEWDIRISRFYGYLTINYEGLWSFWTAEALHYPRLRWLLNRLGQTYFNKTLKFRQDRIEVLQKLIELHMRDAPNEASILHTPQPKSITTLQNEYFGNRIYGHPAHQDISTQFRFVVESLVESGDLTKVDRHTFELSPKSLETLSEYALEERRHNDSVKLNKRMFWTTVAIAIATVVQALAVAEKSPRLSAWVAYVVETLSF